MLHSLQSLEAAITTGTQQLTWLLHPDSWFECIRAARRCAEAESHLDLVLADEQGRVPLAGLCIAEFTAVYETVRDWWPDLSGEGRPTSLAASAYEGLVIELRKLAREQAERPESEPTARLALPPVDHPLLAEPDRAPRFWRAFLAADQAPSVRAYATDFAGSPDAVEMLRRHAWLRVVLQRQMTMSWSGDLQCALVGAYSDQDRERMVAEERAAFADLGLAWLTDPLADSLGLLQSLRRRRPFKAQPWQRGSEAERDAAEITVLIPSFRHEAYVEETVASVLGQTLRELRVLVVDDQSPDATLQRARSIDDPRLTVRANDGNLGLGNSVLQALASITTPYVALLNSDDLFHPERLARCLDVLRTDAQCHLVSTGLMLIDRESKRLTTRTVSTLFDGRNVHDWVCWYERTKPRSARRLDMFGALLERNFLATSSNIVCRTDWLRGRSEALRSLKFCLDWQLFLDAARERCLRWLPDDLIAYRLHPRNTVWFSEEARWVYTLEVNRVAARAIHDLIASLPEKGRTRVETPLRYIAEHLRRNTEIDWTGLYLNELLGGLQLERHTRSSKRVAALASELEQDARMQGVESLRQAMHRQRQLETRLIVTRDEVYSLQGRDEWQRQRIEGDGLRLRHQQQEIAELKNQGQQLLLELTNLRNASAQESTAARHRLEEAIRRHQNCLADLEQAQAALQSAASQLTSVRADLHTTEQRLAVSVHESAALSQRLDTEVERRRQAEQVLHSEREMRQRSEQELATETSARQQREAELAEQISLCHQREASLAAEIGRRQQLEANLAEQITLCQQREAFLAAETSQRQQLEADLAEQITLCQQREAFLAAETSRRRQLEAELASTRQRANEQHLADERTAAHLARVAAQADLAAAAKAAATLQLRGIRFTPGGTTGQLLRRLAKWRRKLGEWTASLRPRLPGWRHPRPAVIAAMPPGECEELSFLCAEAGVDRVSVTMRDGNQLPLALMPPLASGETLAWSFPERHQACWRWFRHRQRQRVDDLLASVMESCSLDATSAREAIAPHFEFARVLTRRRCDLVAGGPCPDSLTRTAVAARLLGRPWLATFASTEDLGRLGAWLVAEIRRANLVIVRSTEIADALASRGAPRERMVMRPPPIGLLAAPGTPRQHEQLCLLAIGSLREDHGWESLVEAVAEVRDLGLSLRLLALAESPRDHLPSLALAARLQAWVPQRLPGSSLTVTAAITAEQVRSILASRPAIFVAPWRPRQGPASLDPFLLAAMAANLPRIATDKVSTRALMSDGLDGIVIPAGDRTALPRAIRALAVDVALQRTLAAAGLARFRSEFDPGRLRAELATRFRGLLAPS